MGAAKPKKLRALHSIRNIRINLFHKKARKLSSLRGADALLVCLPPMSSTNFIADRNGSLNPNLRPFPNQEQRRVSLQEEFVAMNKVLEKVRARLRFLESESKQNAENSSNQEGDLTSFTPTVVDDDGPADQC